MVWNSSEQMQRHSNKKNTIDIGQNQTKTPPCLIEKNKDKAIEKHAKDWENKREDELWVYTDGSKKGKEASISWVLMGGEELVEERRGMKVAAEWSITKVEICAIGVALRDMRRWGKDKIRIFTDSMSGVMIIRNMKEEGDTAPLWD